MIIPPKINLICFKSGVVLDNLFLHLGEEYNSEAIIRGQNEEKVTRIVIAVVLLLLFIYVFSCKVVYRPGLQLENFKQRTYPHDTVQ